MFPIKEYLYLTCVKSLQVNFYSIVARTELDGCLKLGNESKNVHYVRKLVISYVKGYLPMDYKQVQKYKYCILLFMTK